MFLKFLFSHMITAVVSFEFYYRISRSDFMFIFSTKTGQLIYFYSFQARGHFMNKLLTSPQRINDRYKGEMFLLSLRFNSNEYLIIPFPVYKMYLC